MPRHWQADEITPFEINRILDPKPSKGIVAAGLEHLAQAFPAFKGVKLTHEWAGLMDVTPDAVPIIGAVPLVEGLFLSTGYSGHGFGLGPGAGALMADLITGAKPLVDPSLFRAERFRRLAPDTAGRRQAAQGMSTGPAECRCCR
ncbi:FAD-binding oxidoreductase [Mesorhizobium huakuii]|uniref:FAD-binding oxidoreductase n=2 Tax=Mesorhizobium huakuii TaxID=28104 RepID=A0A7G6T3Y5_9HYPH|nr:FAD-binding oxidoreductase [Mesorhizobium huakuii]